jgi:hypothetical protein
VSNSPICQSSNNYLVDVKSGIIMDVEATRAIRQAEVGAARCRARAGCWNGKGVMIR